MVVRVYIEGRWIVEIACSATRITGKDEHGQLNQGS